MCFGCSVIMIGIVMQAMLVSQTVLGSSGLFLASPPSKDTGPQGRCEAPGAHGPSPVSGRGAPQGRGRGTCGREGGAGSPRHPRVRAPAPGQNARDSLPFIKSLSAPGGGNRRFPPEDTRFLAQVPQWKSEPEQVNPDTELSGPGIPSLRRSVPPTSHNRPAALRLIARAEPHVRFHCPRHPAPPSRRRGRG